MIVSRFKPINAEKHLSKISPNHKAHKRLVYWTCWQARGSYHGCLCFWEDQSICCLIKKCSRRMFVLSVTATDLKAPILNKCVVSLYSMCRNKTHCVSLRPEKHLMYLQPPWNIHLQKLWLFQLMIFFLIFWWIFTFSAPAEYKTTLVTSMWNLFTALTWTPASLLFHSTTSGQKQTPHAAWFNFAKSWLSRSSHLTS